jgi:hypothetical protein
MAPMALEGHMGAPLEIDVCASCRAFWFDRRESLQLAPASTLRLFTLIGSEAGARSTIAALLKCPRCAARLLKTNDLQRNTAFRYWRCPHEHGRFITFFDFLREKDFIRPLSAAQLAELRRNVQTVNCSNCGGPVDLARGGECTHCGSPLSLLDMRQAERVVAELRRASQPRPIDPLLPIELARARREVDAAFAAVEPGPQWWSDASSFGLVEAGLAVVSRWLKKSGI